jgi:phage baseplate assembly protein W
MAFGIGPKLTLAPNVEDGAYGLLKNISEVAKQNLKMIVLTNPGERVMDADFGVGLKRYLFELSNTQIKQVIRQKIIDQVSKYLPYVRVDNVNVASSRSNPNTLGVRIEYSIPSSGLRRQTMDIKVS